MVQVLNTSTAVHDDASFGKRKLPGRKGRIRAYGTVYRTRYPVPPNATPRGDHAV